MIPVLEHTPSGNKPVLTNVDNKKWAFSFKYWRQIEYFGMDRSDSSWFISLIEKLRELSDKEIDRFVSTGSDRGSWRYHNIDWNQKNIPLKRSDIDWIDKDYQENAEEYPIVQFQISQALGRVIGFWDENRIFNILLFDPLHNMQPSKRYNYKVDDCSPLSCHYSALLYQLDQLKKQNLCSDPSCKNNAELKKIPTSNVYTNVVMHFLDDTDMEEAQKLITSQKARDEIEIFQAGLLYLSE